MKDKKMLFIGIIAIVIIIAIVVTVILNKNKNKENDINNEIDTNVDQSLIFEEELDPEEIEAINNQRAQEIRRLRK